MNKDKKYYIFKMKLSTLNIISILLLILMVIVTFIVYKIMNLDFNITFDNRSIGILWITYIIYIILHEIVHSIAYVLFGADFAKITYGAHIEKGILCCLCKQNIDRKNILNSLLFPFFYLGIVTYISGVLFNNELLIILSILNISGCAGDLIMFKYFIKLKDIEYTEFDDPISFAIFTHKDLSTEKPFGLEYIECKNEVKRTIDKKVTVSKSSYIFLILFTILSIILLFL